MYAIIHLGTSERVAESINENWLHSIIADFKIYKNTKNHSWRIVHSEYDVTNMDYEIHSKCEFEVMSIEYPTGGNIRCDV